MSATEHYASSTKTNPQHLHAYYRDIFNVEFNLGFAFPRTDTCATCDKLSMKLRMSEGTEKGKLEKQLKEHQDLAGARFEVKKSDKEGAIKDWYGMPLPVGSAAVKHRTKDVIDESHTTSNRTWKHLIFNIMIRFVKDSYGLIILVLMIASQTWDMCICGTRPPLNVGQWKLLTDFTTFLQSSKQEQGKFELFCFRNIGRLHQRF